VYVAGENLLTNIAGGPKSKPHLNELLVAINRIKCASNKYVANKAVLSSLARSGIFSDT